MRLGSVALYTLSALTIFYLMGCASSTPQVDSYLKNHFDGPKSHVIEGVPFFEQAQGHCGPATLAMVMAWAGQNVVVDDLVEQVYTSGAGGSFQQDMISAARRNGFMAMPIVGLEALLAEVSAGHPVIVFENLSVSWLPQWHYAVVYGYNLSREVIIMHSGLEKAKHWDMRRFERSWRLGEYWGLVVLRPGQLSVVASELDHMRAASHLEQLGMIDAADQSYRKILERWPTSLAANIGAANVAFQKKNYSEAVRLLRRATREHPDSAMARHNLAIAFRTKRYVESFRKAARRASGAINGWSPDVIK